MGSCGCDSTTPPATRCAETRGCFFGGGAPGAAIQQSQQPPGVQQPAVVAGGGAPAAATQQPQQPLGVQQLPQQLPRQQQPPQHIPVAQLHLQQPQFQWQIPTNQPAALHPANPGFAIPNWQAHPMIFRLAENKLKHAEKLQTDILKFFFTVSKCN